MNTTTYDTATIVGAAEQRGWDRGYSLLTASPEFASLPITVADRAWNLGRDLYPDNDLLAAACKDAFLAGARAAIQ